jgi:hypothetical protein
MDRVVMEIVETEGVYVRDLQQVIEVSETEVTGKVRPCNVNIKAGSQISS